MDTMTTNTAFPRVLDLTTPKRVLAARCDRCGGAGGWQGWPGFTCFRCGGSGTDPTHRSWGFPAAWTDEQCQQWEDARDARNRAARERAEAKREAERLATYGDNASRTGDLFEQLALLPDLPEFARSILDQARTRTLSDAQVGALRKALDVGRQRMAEDQAEDERRAVAQPC